MHNISKSVVKKDHAPKMEGRSVYVCGMDKHGVLCGKLLRSRYVRAKLLSVKVPELPDGYYYVDRTDVPGDNNMNIVMDDTPVYARETVEYIGEPIGMVCGPDEAVCQDILSRIQVEYEELEPMLDLRKADEAFFNYEYEKGDIDVAFAQAAKANVLRAYSEKLVLTRGRVSAEYRKTVCMNLLGDFLTEKGI